MNLSIMQPYFFPYIGYFQLIAATQRFVIYDNIKYTKKGWINRNRFLLDGRDFVFSIPLIKDSDFLDIRERRISPEYQRDKLARQIQAAYRRAPQFETIYPAIDEIINYPSNNLFDYIRYSIKRLCELLEINTELFISSNVSIDHNLKSQEKVLALCLQLGADKYINSIGGLGLYSREEFQRAGVILKFIKTRPIEYNQFGSSFIPYLSIIDVLMFNPLPQVKVWVKYEYDLI